jgi:hypothetical protein
MSYEIHNLYPMRMGSNEFENIQLGSSSLEQKYPILMKCIRLFCKLHTMSSRWMGSFVLSNLCLVCIPQYEWGDEIQPMRSHHAPTPTNEVPPRQWPGTQYCHRDATSRGRWATQSTSCVLPGAKGYHRVRNTHHTENPLSGYRIHPLQTTGYLTFMSGYEMPLCQGTHLGVFYFRGYQT